MDHFQMWHTLLYKNTFLMINNPSTGVTTNHMLAMKCYRTGDVCQVIDIGLKSNSAQVLTVGWKQKCIKYIDIHNI